jgi:hypothetical protein
MNIPAISRFGLVLLLLAVGGVIGGCNTTRDQDPEANPKTTTIPFQPMSYMARLRAAEGPYPNLYSGDSYALWVGPEMTAQRRESSEATGEIAAPEADAIAPIIEERYIVFECHLISLFGDMSIGYDAVGLRNVEVYFEDNNGRRIEPVQVGTTGKLDESMQGAIRVFRRSCLIVFPREALTVTVPVPPGQLPTARLVLATLDTKFYFDWQPILNPEEIGTPLRDRAWVQASKMGYNQFYTGLKGFLHNFD